MSSEHLTKIKSVELEAAKSILHTAYSFDVEDPLNYLSEIKFKSFLRQGGNLLLYSNHIAIDDPVVETLFYTQYIDPKRERHFIIPASHWHTNPKNSMVFHMAAKATEFFFGAEIFRLIQKYMVNNPKYGSYTAEDASDNHFAFFSRLKKLRKDQVPTTLLVYPEGHRSEDGVLQSIEDGFIGAGRIMSPTVCVPLAIYYKTPFFRKSLNLRVTGHHAHISVGTPYYILKKNEEPSATYLMQNLAKSLPSQMRGPYV